MSSIPFPPTIDFSNIKPKGYSAQIVNREFTPAPFNANVAQQDLIRFMINQHRGFWDPYSAYFDVEVDFTGMSPVGVQQIDGSAHSLISRLQLYVNGVSLELIDEYDSLLHFLHDMQMSRENKKLKFSEGVGMDQGGFDTGSQSFGNTTKCTESFGSVYMSQGSVANSIMRTQTPAQWLMDTIPSSLSGIQQPQNPNYNTWNTMALSSGGLMLPEEFEALTFSRIEPYHWGLASQQMGVAAGTDFGLLDTRIANTDAMNNLPLTRYERSLAANNFAYSPVNMTSHVNKVFSGYGANGIFSGNFCNHNFEQTYGTNYTQFHIKNGNIGVQSIIPVASFQFPLASSILGTLLPADSYKYLPFSALPDLVIEVTLNKYAFFTSGYIEDEDSAVIANWSDLGCRKTPMTQQARYWKINKFNLNVDIILFDDQSIEDMINAQLVTNGILLHTCGWTLCLKQVFNTTSQCAGNFQINYGFESLKALFVMYELNDYQQYTFCRKHFRCSRNVTSLQLRIGEKIYPQTPIQGHGGNALKYDQVVRTNQQFVQELYKSFNKQFTINSEAAINMANFATNKRSYNVKPIVNLGAYFVQVDPNTPQGQWQFNYDVQVGMGQSLLYENQLRGMAAYCINLDVLGNDNNVMGGVDTKQNVPFNILITTDATDTGNYPDNNIIDLSGENPVTGQFWAYYDCLYLFKAGAAPQKIGAQ